jgi:hypothetical protein
VTEAAFPAAALRQLDEDEAQPHVFRLLAAQFTKLNSDVASHFTEMQESSSETGDGDSEDGATAGEAVATDVLCPARGASVSPRAAVRCSKHQCPVQALHSACMDTCNACKKAFCTQHCAGDHAVRRNDGWVVFCSCVFININGNPRPRYVERSVSSGTESLIFQENKSA